MPFAYFSFFFSPEKGPFVDFLPVDGSSPNARAGCRGFLTLLIAVLFWLRIKSVDGSCFSFPRNFFQSVFSACTPVLTLEESNIGLSLPPPLRRETTPACFSYSAGVRKILEEFFSPVPTAWCDLF